ncbi:hypothetical protein DBR17_17850 [Sphingomonas sp. HMWF008]|nr:hypothetical protein DBR17_17850 [Sphingomonas sp. HMWF008]
MSNINSDVQSVVPTVAIGIGEDGQRAIPVSQKNPMPVLGQRASPIVRSIIANTAVTYASGGVCIGGLQFLDLGAGAAGQTLTNAQLRLMVRYSDHVGAITFGCYVFDAAPASSTFTDNATMVLHANDFAKAIVIPASPSFQGPGAPGLMSANIALPRITPDAQNRIYYALVTAAAAMQFATASAIAARLEGTF